MEGGIMFIEPDEHLIVMDEYGNHLLPDELKALADVGVKTIYAHGIISWERMQPTEGDLINWSELDAYISKIRKAGLKVLLPFAHNMPTWKPDDWYYVRETSRGNGGIPSYTHKQTGYDLDAFALEIIYNYLDDAQVIFSIPNDGEFPFHDWPTDGECHVPIDAFTNFVCNRQRVFNMSNGEVWTSYHHTMSPVYIDPLYAEMNWQFPGSQHYGIQFTYFPHGQGLMDKVISTSRKYGVKYYVGAEYCQGLRPNVPLCIEQRMHGVIVAPIHSFQTHHRVDEKWMLDDIEWAIKTFNESYHNEVI
jgi:hypothetical protein